VLAALDRLGDGDRTVLAYRYLLDLDVAEITALLGRPQRTVRSRIRRALQRLQRLLDDDDSAIPDLATADRSEHSRA
jgi:RNA polymerase sigma factor (sigma-70 family)